jgi:iduronate 2-sulfatase
VFPTLTELAGLPTPKGAVGNSLTTLIDSPGSSGRPAVGYFKKARTIRTDTHRLIAHDDGFMELYDHRSAAGETENLAEAQPELANELLALIEARL